MSYFNKFQILDYDFSTSIKPNVRKITDLTTRVVMNVGNAKTVKVMFDPYLINDTDTPEIISYFLYGTPFYHWTILYVNNITNMQTDWPLSAVQLNDFLKRKYTTEELSEVIMYKTSTGIVGDYDWIYSQYNEIPRSVTRYDYEVEENEKKRQIVIVSPTYINSWVSTFMSKL